MTTSFAAPLKPSWSRSETRLGVETWTRARQVSTATFTSFIPSSVDHQSRGVGGLLGSAHAFAPFTFSLRLKTLSPQVAYKTSKVSPPKDRFETRPFGVVIMQLTL